MADSKVEDMRLAEFCRKKQTLEEHEMPSAQMSPCTIASNMAAVRPEVQTMEKIVEMAVVQIQEVIRQVPRKRQDSSGCYETASQ